MFEAAIDKLEMSGTERENLEDFSSAIKYSLKVVELVQGKNDKYSKYTLASSYSHIVKYYKRVGNKEKNVKYLEKGKMVLEEMQTSMKMRHPATLSLRSWLRRAGPRAMEIQI